MREAIMYNKHTPLLRLEIEGAIVLAIKDVLNTTHLPIILQDDLSEQTLNQWIGKRIIPDKRDGIEEARKFFPAFERYENMFSLSDQYWFRYRKQETWEKLNFFHNPYSTVVGDIFFSPWSIEEKELTSHSPDLTTNGVLKKVWIKEGNTSYLYKAGSEVYHQEPLSEVLASITLSRLKMIPFVNYELAVNGLELCSKCKNFIDEYTEFVPASYIYARKARPEGKSVYDHLIAMCDEYGIVGAKEYMDNMIAADRIIGNDDRHLGNFGFIRDVETATITGFAPLFDSGSAYWGKASVSKKARLFSEQEQDALQEVMQKLDLGVMLDHKEMFRLINMYPKIGQKKRNEIKERILASEQEIEHLLQSVSDRKRPAKKEEKARREERGR